MTLSAKLRARAVLPSLSLLLACSTGKPPDPEDQFTGGTGGTTGTTGGASGSSGTDTGGSSATGQGGSSADGQGGSAAAEQGGTSAVGGSGATAAMGGTDTGTGGVSAAGGTGGDAAGGTGGAGGVGGASGTGGTTGGAGGTDPGICQELSVIPTRQVPTVEILVDDSSSMYEPDNLHPNPWEMLYAALMDDATGAIKPLQDQVRFGFASFRSPKNHSVPETDESCAEMVTVPITLSNYDAINTAYTAVGLDARFPQGCGDTPNGPGCGQTQWDTPTGHSINRVAAELTAFTEDPPGKKFILFVTDGTPNTCLVGDPNCGQDLAIAAVQNAFTAGIGTFVIGIGNIIANDQCDAQAGRCGEDHLQDIANAGVGEPVAPPPMSFWYSQCATMQTGTNPGTPVSVYADSAATAGTAKYYTATDAEQLRTTLTGLLNDVISCTVEMDAYVEGDPSLGMVSVAGNAVGFQDPNGWTLEADNVSVTLQGSACDVFKGGSDVHIAFPCDENGNPIAVHR